MISVDLIVNTSITTGIYAMSFSDAIEYLNDLWCTIEKLQLAAVIDKLQCPPFSFTKFFF